MADCQIAKITDNIVSSVNNKTIEVNGENVTTFAEQQRFILDSQGHDVYIEVCGPWPNTLEDSGNEQHDALHYVLETHLYGLNDIPPANPVTQQIKNAGEGLRALIMVDITRGGNALLTRIDGQPYYYITGTVEAPEIVIRVDVVVQIFSNII